MSKGVGGGGRSSGGGAASASGGAGGSGLTPAQIARYARTNTLSARERTINEGLRNRRNLSPARRERLLRRRDGIRRSVDKLWDR